MIGYRLKIGVLFTLFVVFCLPIASQKVAVKNNFLYDLTATPNLGVEFCFAPKWTADISGNYNPIAFSDGKKWKHWIVQPEVRYWFCESFNRHFVGMHLVGGVFNTGKINARPICFFPTHKDYRYEGESYGIGLGYGYHHILTPRISLEYSVGLGYVHSNYEQFQCMHCGDYIDTGKKDYFGLTKAAVSLVIMLD